MTDSGIDDEFADLLMAPAFPNFRISFKGFTKSIEDRSKFIASFMRQHFENVSFSYFGTRMTGPYDKKPSDESFIQFVCQEERNCILNIITSKKLGASLRSPTGTQLAIVRSKSDWIRQRDFAMRQSER